MKITRAIGLALVIIILQFLVPRVWQAAEEAVISLLHTSKTSFGVMQATAIKAGNNLPVPTIR